MKRVLLLMASRFAFVPKGEDRRITGTKLTFISEDCTHDEGEEGGGREGHEVVTMNAPPHIYAKVGQVPCLLDIEIDVQQTSKGATPKIANVQHVAAIDLQTLFAADLKVKG